MQFLLLLPPPSPVFHDHLSKRRTRPPDPTQAGYRPLPGPCSPDTHPPKSHRPASPRPTSRPARLVPHQKPGSWRAARRTSRKRKRRCGRGTTGARRGRKRFRARRLRGLGICLPAISCTSKGIRNKLREESLREREGERERENEHFFEDPDVVRDRKGVARVLVRKEVEEIVPPAPSDSREACFSGRVSLCQLHGGKGNPPNPKSRVADLKTKAVLRRT